MSFERLESRLVENLRDQPHVLVDHDVVSVADRNARRLLAAVLQGIQAVVRQFGNLIARSPHPKNTACVLRSFFTGQQVVGEESITAGHTSSLRV